MLWEKTTTGADPAIRGSNRSITENGSYSHAMMTLTKILVSSNTFGAQGEDLGASLTRQSRRGKSLRAPRVPFQTSLSAF